MTTYKRRSDAYLMRISRRDPAAFVEVCRRHSDALAAYLGSHLHDDGLTRELLAETLSEAWFGRERFRDPGDGLARAWLFGIAKNLLRRVYRDREIESRARARLGLPTESADAYLDVLDRLGAGQQLEQLESRLELLPAEQREALELRVVDELEYEEIADRLAITAGGARTRVFRALNTLRTQTQKES